MNEDVQLVFSLIASSRRIERRFNGILSNVLGVSFSEYFLLKQLGENHAGAATRRDLAISVHLTASAVTRALKPLEKIGYVGTTKNDRDARQTIATLSPAGQKLIENADSLIADEVTAMSLGKTATSLVVPILAALGTST